MKPGDLTPKKNHRFIRRIESINELIGELDKQDSMWFRHRMYPTAVIRHQSLEGLRRAIAYGNVWVTEKLKKW